MAGILDLSAREIAKAVHERSVSAIEIAEAALARVRERDPHVGAYLSVTEELAREQARRVDERIAAGERPALAGVPIWLQRCGRSQPTVSWSK